ncbi:MAG: hypothetical protein L3J46_07075, partial [Kangiellaceae bacterium]|nr:hypothetical protein [Kangiellaceae bacterium]
MKTKRLLRNSNILSSALLVIVLLATNFYANADENLLLSNILLKSIDKNVANFRSDDLPTYQTSRWLAASPSVQLSYLRSQEELGADEIELGINWSMKSSMQRKIDDKLITLNNTIIAHQKNLTKLYFSGLIRESLWSYKLAEANQQFMQKRLKVLNQLANNSRALVEAGESSDYGLLLIQKELNITRIAILASNQEMQTWQTQYQAVTGESKLPTKFNEPIFDAKQWPVSRHPSIQYKEDSWKQSKLIAQTNSNDSSPWSVGLTAKNTESQGFSDKQIGLSIEVPLSMIKVNSQLIKN